jgi:alkylhydroperoxidase family enzyme
MILKLIHHFINREERRLGVPLNHLRELVNTSVAAFFKLFLLAPLANHRRHLPCDAWHLARLAATQAEDCGDCVQIAVFLARRDGVDADLLRAALLGEADRIQTSLRDVISFATDISRGQDSPQLREQLVASYGQPAVVELGLAIATARFFPTFKRTLGHARACRLIQVHA